MPQEAVMYRRLREQPMHMRPAHRAAFACPRSKGVNANDTYQPNPIDLRRFGATLRALRQARGLTRTALAALLGMTAHVYISNGESGRKQPSLSLVLQASAAPGIWVEALLRGDLAAGGAVSGVPMRWSGVKLRLLREEMGLSQSTFVPR